MKHKQDGGKGREKKKNAYLKLCDNQVIIVFF